jgi:hypothetical protein
MGGRVGSFNDCNMVKKMTSVPLFFANVKFFSRYFKQRILKCVGNLNIILKGHIEDKKKATVKSYLLCV